MIKAAEAERNVAITLQLVAGQGNRSVAQQVNKDVTDAQKTATKSAEAEARARSQVEARQLRERAAEEKKAERESVKAAQQAQKEKERNQQKADREETMRLRRKAKQLVAIRKEEEREAERAEKEATKAAQREARERERAEKEKTRQVEQEAKKREQIAKQEAKAIERYQDKIRKDTEAVQAKYTEGNRKATESSVAALQGMMDLVEGTAILGLTSEENFEKFARGFIKIQAAFKAMKGFTELVWKGRDAIIALQESQEALRKTQALLAAAPIPPMVAAAAAASATGGVRGGGNGVSGIATQVGAEAAGGVIANHIAAKRAAKSAAGEVAEKTATRSGTGLLEMAGIIAANYFGARGFGGAASGAAQAARTTAGRVGSTTVGGILRGTGRAIWGSGRAAYGAGRGLLSRIGGMTVARGGVIGAGSILGYGASEGLSWLNSRFTGRPHGSEPAGPQGLGVGAYFNDLFGRPLYNESPTRAVSSTYRAVSDMFSSGSTVERRQQELEKAKVRNQEVRDRQRDKLSFRFAQDSAYSALDRQKITLGPGTDIEKSKKLEIQAADEVAQARAAAQENYQKQLEAMYRNEAYNSDLQLMHLENIQDKQSQLVSAAQTRLDLLKAQNQQHKESVKSAREELKAAKERTTVAEKAAASDRESKLADFDRLDTVKKNNLRSIAEKVKRNEELSFREVKQLEETPFGAEIAQKYRARRSAGDAGTIRALGGFKDAEKNVADAREDENKKREKLAESIRKERESREAMTQQVDRVRRSMESLAEITDKVARMRAEQAGIEYTPPVAAAAPARENPTVNQGGGAVAAVNNATDVFVQENIALIEALRNLSDTQSGSYRQLREEIERRAQQDAGYAALLHGGL